MKKFLRAVIIGVILGLIAFTGLSLFLTAKLNNSRPSASVRLRNGAVLRGRIAAVTDNFIVLQKKRAIEILMADEVALITYKNQSGDKTIRRFCDMRGSRWGWTIKDYNLQGTRNYPYPSLPVSEDWQLDEIYAFSGISARSGDVTGDGHIELIVNTGRYIKTYNHQADMLKQFRTTTKIPSDFILGDVSGNGILDIVVSYKQGKNYSARAYDYHGQKLATYSRSGDSHGNILLPVAVTDMNGNTRNELVCIENCRFGEGSSGIVVFDAQTGKELSNDEQNPASPGVNWHSRFSLLDFTGNGKMEIVHSGPALESRRFKGSDNISDTEALLFARKWDSTILWQREFDIGHGFKNVEALLYDIFDNKKPVAVAATYDNDWDEWCGDIGQVFFIDPESGDDIPGYSREFEGSARLESVADLNNNGSSEILVSYFRTSSQDGALLVLEAKENLPELHRFEIACNPLSVGAVVDFNGDGEPNIIAFAESMLYIFDGDLKVIYQTDNITNIEDIIVTDLTGNGFKEIILWDQSIVRVYHVLIEDDL